MTHEAGWSGHNDPIACQTLIVLHGYPKYKNDNDPLPPKGKRKAKKKATKANHKARLR